MSNFDKIVLISFTNFGKSALSLPPSTLVFMFFQIDNAPPKKKTCQMQTHNSAGFLLMKYYVFILGTLQLHKRYDVYLSNYTVIYHISTYIWILSGGIYYTCFIFESCY